MAFTLVLGLTACGGEAADNTGNNNTDSAQSSTDSGKTDSKKSSTFKINDLSFTVVGDFKELASKEDSIAFKNDEFAITANYQGETSYTSQEEKVKYVAHATEKSHEGSTVEVKEKNGIFYYTFIGGDYDHVSTTYLVNGVAVDFITSDFSDEAINAITSIKFQ